MSESSLSDPLPSDTTLEQALRHAVQAIYQKGNLEDLTVKRVRKAAEEDLELQDGFFKQDPSWKEKSKLIIEAEAAAQAKSASTGDVSGSQTSFPPNDPEKQSTGSKRRSTSKPDRSTEARSKKRRKEDVDSALKDDVSEDDGGTRPSSTQVKDVPSKKLRPAPAGVSENGPPEGEFVKPTDSKKDGKDASQTAEVEDESELSSVIDEEPKTKPKPKRRRSGSAEHKTNAKAKTKDKKPKESNVDPEAEEIKRLQGWLVKCGIRKMWYKELAPYDSPKAKIRHLKEMLADAGMTGRYSVEKASQIREARELKSELEAVQAGAKQWGKTESDEEAETKPKRRLARGLKELDFLNDSDGEETD